MPLKLVRRMDWGALHPRNKNALTPPVKTVFYMNTASERCHTGIDCIRAVQMLQDFHMHIRGLTDIRYNFLVGGDGVVYEGRGWQTAPLLPIKYMEHYSLSIIIAFIGRFTEESLPNLMLRAGGDLIDYGVNMKYIDKDFNAISIFKSTPTQHNVEPNIEPIP